MTLVNTKLLSHPINWLTIPLMLMIAGIAGHFLLSLTGTEPATPVSKAASPYTQF